MTVSVDGPPPEDDRLEVALERMPEFAKPTFTWLMAHWPGRIALRGAAELTRVQIFDRSMTIAAQLFTSVFPIIIMGAALLGASESRRLAGSAGLDDSAEDVLDDVIASGGVATFGVIGVLAVLVAATSLSRALTRSYDVIWDLPKRKARVLDAWRWVAVVLVLALAVVLARVVVQAVEELPPRDVWSTILSFVIQAGIALFVPWLLLAGQIRVRMLLPGALLYAITILLISPFSSAFLPVALANSAARYGPIGVAFTYLTWLYVVSFTLLATATLGRVLATDVGSVGQFVREEGPLRLRSL